MGLTMKAVIHGYDCSDQADLEGWRPARAEEVYLPLHVYIGPEGSSASDLFQIVIATPQAIQGRPDRRNCKLLVVQQYDWVEVKGTIEQWVAECEALTWEDVVGSLRKRLHWEYEGK
jgi:hypothetical protein